MFLKNYTGKEVESLTDEQVQKIIDFECADAGCPMLPNMPIQPTKPVFKPDMQLFLVGGWYGWYVKTLDEATKILDALANVEIWDTSYAGNDNISRVGHRKADLECKAESVKVFSPELWDKAKSEIESYNILKKTYDTLLSDYNDAAKERGSISSWVWGIVFGARAFKAKREAFLAYKQNYLTLAEGNEELGEKFFLKAYPDAYNYINNFFNHTDIKQQDKLNEIVACE